MKLIPVTAGLAVAAFALVSVPQPSTAAVPVYGMLEIKGPGTVYAAWTYSTSGVPGAHGDVPATTVLPVSPGGTATFAVNVHNTGYNGSTYRVQMRVLGSSSDVPGPIVPVTASLTNTNSLGPKLVLGPDGYEIPPVAQAHPVQLQLKVTLPRATPPGEGEVELVLNDAAGNWLDTIHAVVEQRATTGSTGTDVFGRYASQPFVGGTSYDAVTASQGVPLNGTTTFSVKLQNNRAAVAPIRVQSLMHSPCLTYTVKDGAKDVTAQVQGDQYLTRTLTKGASQTLTVKASRVGLLACHVEYLTFTGTTSARTEAHSVRLYVPDAPPIDGGIVFPF